MKVGEMAQQVKALVATPDNLSSGPRTQSIDREN